MGDQGNTSLGPIVRDYGITIAVAIALAFLIRIFVLEAYRIPTAAMRPALEPGDTIFVSKWSFGGKRRLPKKGEIVLFSLMSDPNRDFIKRVVAMPGERVELRKGALLIDGKPVANPITERGTCGSETLPGGISFGVCWEPPALPDLGPVTIPLGSVFVLGDLRSQNPQLLGGGGESQKIRGWGIIPISAIRGKASWIWLSIEPRSFSPSSGGSSWFPQFRFERMLRRIEP